MAKGKNCPNCGAPYDITETKCPYCGTSYFDMASIDMSTREPFYLKIRVGQYDIIQKVRPDLGEFLSQEETVDCYLGSCNGGQKAASFVVSNHFSTNLSFTAVADYDGSLAKIKQITYSGCEWEE
jgi:hypothetical protein